MSGILMVDDNANIRRLLRSLVDTNTKFEICGEAENGAEAIEKAKELQPDLVLLDMTLPGMSGTEGGARPQEVAAAGKDRTIHDAYGRRQSGVGLDIRY